MGKLLAKSGEDHYRGAHRKDESTLDQDSSTKALIHR